MATYYWRVTSGTMSTASSWSLISNSGAASTTVPGAGDTCIIDRAGVSTITVGTLFECLNLTISTNSTTIAGASASNLNIYGNISVAANQTWTSTGFLNFVGSGNQLLNLQNRPITATVSYSGTGTYTLQSAMLCNSGTNRPHNLNSGTLDLNGFTLTCYRFVSSNSNVRGINFGSTGSIVCTGTGVVTLVEMSDMTNFTCPAHDGPGFSSPQISTGARTFNIGQTAGGNSQNAPNYTCTSPTGNNTPVLNGVYRRLDASVCTAIELGSTNCCSYVSGSKDPSGVYFIGPGVLNLNGRSTGNLWLKYDAQAIAAGGGTTTTLTDITCGGITLDSGTLSLQTFNVTCNGGLVSQQPVTTARGITGTGTITLNSGSITIDTATNVVITPRINLVNASGATIYLGNCTVGTLTVSANAGSNVTFFNSGKYYDLQVLAPTNKIIFYPNTTHTFTNLTLSGEPGRVVTVVSNSSPTQYTFSQATGTVTPSYITISDSNVTGGATWDLISSGTNVNAGNNTGWGAAVAKVISQFMAFFF